MGIISLVVRLLIAATFVVAGSTKFADLQGSRKGIRDFGVPDWAATPLGIMLPLAELAAAALLIPISTVLWGSLGAIALSLAFIIAIAINLAQGRKPECNCFGQLHSTPIGWSTLARNFVLIAGAGLVFWQDVKGSPLSVLDWTKGVSSAEVTAILLGTFALALIAAQACLSFHLMQQNGRLLLRMDALETRPGSAGSASLPASAPAGLPIGSPAPTFELPALSGGSALALETLLAERRPIMLIFSDPDCGPCSALLPDIARWEREQAATLTIALISRGSQEANRTKIAEHRLRYVLLQKDREVATAYRVNATPGAVLIDTDGKIVSNPAMGPQAIAVLVATGARAQLAAPALVNGKNGIGSSVSPTVSLGLQVGQAAPPFKLPDLSGGIVNNLSFRVRETLVLFWNPNCGFCSKMLTDLKLWEETRPAEAPQLLVVSTGTVEANRAMGLRATVVLDQSFALGLAFHVRGTPAAVLVDDNGKIASGVASGAQAVFALANAKHSTVAHRGN